MFFLLKGFVIGMLIAAPVGPIGLLCIRRTLNHGRLSGLLSGIGAVTAHGVYGIVAGLGLTAISGFLLKGKVFLSIAGGLFLCYLGIKTFRTRAANRAAVAQDRGRLQDYLSTFGLTITNPATILTFLGIFAGLTLTSLVGLFSHKISPKLMLIIDKASGTLIFIFGVVALLKM